MIYLLAILQVLGMMFEMVVFKKLLIMQLKLLQQLKMQQRLLMVKLLLGLKLRHRLLLSMLQAAHQLEIFGLTLTMEISSIV